MYIVKLSYNFDWPLFRQTPNFSGVWGNYKFIIDDNLKECDFWIIYSEYKLIEEEVKCNKENIIFIPAEGYNTSNRYPKKFLKQFGLIITVQRQLKHKNIIYSHNANPWFINKSYDQIKNEEPPKKTNLISIISSNKTFTDGHIKRIDFMKQIKEKFGDKIDVFGRGIKDFDNKWDVVAPYKYSIAIENDFSDDWVTEKFFDCLYSETFTFYYGCPNLEKYVNPKTFQRIDINDLGKSIEIIEQIINDPLHYDKVKKYLKEEKFKSIDRDNFFPWVVNILENKNSNLRKHKRVVKGLKFFNTENLLARIVYRLKKKLLNKN